MGAVRAVICAIQLVIATGFAVLRILGIARGDGTAAEKIAGIHDQLANVVDKLESLAKQTDPAWDDTLASVLSDVLDSIAESLIEQLDDQEPSDGGMNA